MKRHAANRPVWADVIHDRSVAQVVTCEHAGNVVPKPFDALLRGHRGLLPTHRGFDAGALRLATALAETLDAPLFVQPVTRLLVDSNRSLTSPELFPPWIAKASDEVRRALLERVYLPYRRAAEAAISARIARGRRVLHLSAHSFTPVRNGERRNVDVGLLYDPGRGNEAAFASELAARLVARFPRLRVAHNEPYAGTDDGFTSYVRNRFTAYEYLGLEIELSQRLVRQDVWDPNELADVVHDAWLGASSGGHVSGGRKRPWRRRPARAR